MNREAVALGVPVWTIFSGRMGAVDEALIAEGRLARARPTRRRSSCASASATPGPVNPRDPAILVDGALGGRSVDRPGSLLRGSGR